LKEIKITSSSLKNKKGAGVAPILYQNENVKNINTRSIAISVQIHFKEGAALISKRMGNFFYKPFTKNKKPQPMVGLICNVSISHEK